MNSNERKQVFHVSGMSCGHCKAAVESAIKETSGVVDAQVDLAGGKAVVEGNFSDEAVVDSVKEAGYEAAVAEE